MRDSYSVMMERQRRKGFQDEFATSVVWRGCQPSKVFGGWKPSHLEAGLLLSSWLTLASSLQLSQARSLHTLCWCPRDLRTRICVLSESNGRNHALEAIEVGIVHRRRALQLLRSYRGGRAAIGAGVSPQRRRGSTSRGHGRGPCSSQEAVGRTCRTRW